MTLLPGGGLAFTATEAPFVERLLLANDPEVSYLAGLDQATTDGLLTMRDQLRAFAAAEQVSAGQEVTHG